MQHLHKLLLSLIKVILRYYELKKKSPSPTPQAFTIKAEQYLSDRVKLHEIIEECEPDKPSLVNPHPIDRRPFFRFLAQEIQYLQNMVGGFKEENEAEFKLRLKEFFVDCYTLITNPRNTRCEVRNHYTHGTPLPTLEAMKKCDAGIYLEAEFLQVYRITNSIPAKEIQEKIQELEIDINEICKEYKNSSDTKNGKDLREASKNPEAFCKLAHDLFDLTLINSSPKPTDVCAATRISISSSSCSSSSYERDISNDISPLTPTPAEPLPTPNKAPTVEALVKDTASLSASTVDKEISTIPPLRRDSTSDGNKMPIQSTTTSPVTTRNLLNEIRIKDAQINTLNTQVNSLKGQQEKNLEKIRTLTTEKNDLQDRVNALEAALAKRPAPPLPATKPDPAFFKRAHPPTSLPPHREAIASPAIPEIPSAPTLEPSSSQVSMPG